MCDWLIRISNLPRSGFSLGQLGAKYTAALPLRSGMRVDLRRFLGVECV